MFDLIIDNNICAWQDRIRESVTLIPLDVFWATPMIESIAIVVYGSRYATTDKHNVRTNKHLTPVLFIDSFADALNTYPSYDHVVFNDLAGLNHTRLRYLYISNNYEYSAPYIQYSVGFKRYDFCNHDERRYLDLLRELVDAPARPNRTGIPTHGVFSRSLRFKLCDNGIPVLPLLTTKKTFLRSIYHELIWFLRGSSTTTYLKDNNVKIWNANSTREYLDSRNLIDYKPGELGPIYGYQWRKWGQEYNENTSNNPTDQLNDVICEIKTNPGSRRLLISAWNVSDIAKMALPPCHYSFQFHVGFYNGEPKYLNCLVNMRSADVALGVPFNIASYALLTHIVAQITSLVPNEIDIHMCDCHIYSNHIDGITEQLKRTPKRFPKITFSKNITDAKDITIDDFANNYTYDDIIISDYDNDPYIRLPMAV